MTPDETSIPTPSGRVTIAAALVALGQEMSDGAYHPVKLSWFSRRIHRSRAMGYYILRRLVEMGLIERERTTPGAVSRYRVRELVVNPPKPVNDTASAVPAVTIKPKKPKRKKAA